LFPSCYQKNNESRPRQLLKAKPDCSFFSLSTIKNMMTHPSEMNPGGVNGSGTGQLELSAEELAILRQKISASTHNQSISQVRESKVLGVKLQMVRYLDEEQADLIPLGSFLKTLLTELGIRHRRFAAYIGLHPSNLSALLAGKRSLNSQSAIKLGAIFHISPEIWVKIQAKNDLMETEATHFAEEDPVSLPMWTCPRCERRFKSPNQSHTCSDTTIGELFLDRSDELVLAFDRILQAVMQWQPNSVGAARHAVPSHH
jgi:addiction module HigA family antidote